MFCGLLNRLATIADLEFKQGGQKSTNNINNNKNNINPNFSNNNNDNDYDISNNLNNNNNNNNKNNNNNVEYNGEPSNNVKNHIEYGSKKVICGDGIKEGPEEKIVMTSRTSSVWLGHVDTDYLFLMRFTCEFEC